MPPLRSGLHKNQQNNDGQKSIQKLKATLRSARRLLAKEGLDAQTRIDTERLAAGAEKEIADLDLSRQEREYATKYHMVKFFDKKKALRKISQIKKKLSQDLEDAQERKSLEKQLIEKRVDLNYILNFPKLEKYIALYPSEKGESSSKGKGKEEEGTTETNGRRDELRASIRAAMENGELSLEPELLTAQSTSMDTEEHPQKSSIPSKSKERRKDPTKKKKEKGASLENDDFFGTE